MRAALSTLVTCVTVFLGGCNQPPQPGAGSGTVKPVAGYDFEVRGADGSYTKGQGATFSVQAGANSAEVKDGKLTVNGKAYGAVADGATIRVDGNGNVSVNGEERSPE
jgi:hypothetical protein